MDTREEKGEIVIYKDEDGHTLIDVRFQGETIWLTQKQIAVLFGTQRPAITKHLGNILKSKELREDSVSSILEHTVCYGRRIDKYLKLRFKNTIDESIVK